MYLTETLVREQIRGQLELAEQIRFTRKYRALSRARRAERKAERRLLAAWHARSALEATLSAE
jgi:hypothetical protein